MFQTSSEGLQPESDSRAVILAERVKYLCSPINDSYKCLPFLYDYVIRRNPINILELGVHMGYSTRILLLGASQYGGHVDSVDIALNDAVKSTMENINKWGLNRFWTLIINDSLYVNWTKDIDMLYIDSLHTYPHTLYELEKYYEFCNDNTRIFLHDCSHPLYKEDIMRSIREFTYNIGWEYEILTEETNGLAMLYKGDINEISRMV